MKLARVLATDCAKVLTPAAPRVAPAQARSSSDSESNDKVCCGSCKDGGTSASASKEEHWSCGVCYEEFCCPFSLPCGHTVCGNCLQQLLGRQAICPFCRVSVFRGCIFGRNVAMWNAIQARHPQAAQLSDSSAVITYHPTCPVRSTSRDQDDARPRHQSIANEQALHGRRRTADFIQSIMHNVMVRNQAEQQNTSEAPVSPGSGNGGRSPTSPGAASSSIASRVGLGLLAPLRLDSQVDETLSASSSRAESASVSQYPAVVTGARPLHLSPTRVPRSASNESSASPSQSEHLRRAQAAFADLRVRDFYPNFRRNSLLL
ncbi:hypothetical protein WJX77_007308 [Trebouxia sp. C0004]